MPTRNMRIVLILLVVLAGAWISLLYTHWEPGIHVSISNQSTGVLANMELVYTGGAIHIEKLEPGAMFRKQINSTGESHLELQWRDRDGNEHEEYIDVYFEPNYLGTISMVLDREERLSWTDNTNIKAIVRGLTAWDLVILFISGILILVMVHSLQRPLVVKQEIQAADASVSLGMKDKR